MRARCADEPDLFFPEGYLGKQEPDDIGPPDYHSEDSERARSLCAVCPLRAQCLEWALEAQPEYGITAGLDPDEIMREVVKRELLDRGM